MNYSNFITRYTSLSHGIKMSCTIPAPNIFDLSQSMALGTSYSERDEHLHEMIETMLEPQYVRAAKSIIHAYESCELPISMIHRLNFHIGPMGFENPAMFCYELNAVFMDSDASCGMGLENENFIFGHEIGHKILCQKMIDRKNELHYALLRISSILSISKNSDAFVEVVCDEIGNLVSDKLCFNHPIEMALSTGERQEIQRTLLYIAYC